MHDSLLLCLALIFSAAVLVLVARKLSISYPVFLVISGLLISFVPWMPVVRIDPNIVFVMILPPVLFDAAQNTSWKALWKWRRMVGVMAVGYTLLTATVVAFLSCWLIPGFSLSHGFLLGAIVSPPDPTAAIAILKKNNLPKGLVNILEGEGLLNGATSLTIYRVALAAIMTNQFSWQWAVGNFMLASGAGIAIGLVFGLVFYAIYKWLPATANLDIALSFVLPYSIFLTAEAFQASSVLAVVTGGLFISYQNNHVFSHNTRLRANAVWPAVIFTLNIVIFFLIGLQLPSITSGLTNIPDGLLIALLISLIIIATRLVAGQLSALFTAFISKYVKVVVNQPGWRNPMIMSWAGMRGVVSLASALAIPLSLPGAEAFPFRPLILLITFIVIIITLVGQGLALPWIITTLKPEMLPDVKAEEQQILEIEALLYTTAVDELKNNYADLVEANPLLRNKMELLTFNAHIYQAFGDDTTKKGDAAAMARQFNRTMLLIAEYQRKQLRIFRRKAEFDEDIIRLVENRLDLEEQRLDDGAE